MNARSLIFLIGEGSMQILKEEIRNSILQASLEEFYIKGYEKASLVEIAKRCGISKSNVYHYFPSKKSIYEALTTPALNQIAIATKLLTTKRSCPNQVDDVAREFTEILKHDVYRYRKEIAILIQDTSKNNEHPIMEMFQQELIQCFMQLDRKLRCELISLDGALILNKDGKICACGAIIKNDSGSTGGARGAASQKLSRYGFAVKISTDGYIELYINGKKVYSIK